MEVISTSISKHRNDDNDNDISKRKITKTMKTDYIILYDYLISEYGGKINLPNEFIQYEEQIIKNQYDVTIWISYIEMIDEYIIDEEKFFVNKKDNKTNTNMICINSICYTKYSILLSLRDMINRRSCQLLPRSYKLWKYLWEFLIKQYKLKQSSQQNDNDTLSFFHIDFITITSCFQRSIITLSIYPKVWIIYIQWLIQQYDYYYQQNNNNGENVTENNNNNNNNNNNILILLSATRFRHIIDHALSSVSITQHDKIWNSFIDWLFELDYYENKKQQGEDDNNDNNNYYHLIPIETTYRLLKRYCILYPNNSMMRYGKWCEKHNKYGPAAQAYVTVLNANAKNNKVIIVTEEERYQCWILFCDLITNHSEDIDYKNTGISWENILRSTINQQINNQSGNNNKKKQNNTSSSLVSSINIVELSDMYKESGNNNTNSNNNHSLLLGLLYTQLATTYTNRGEFDLARTTYEEGLNYVNTVRDFTILYSSYLELEDGLLNHIIEEMDILEEQENEENEEEEESGQNADVDDEDEDDIDIDHDDGNNKRRNKHKQQQTSKISEMELAMERAEHLTKMRPILLNAVKLRQNPLNVQLYIERSQLYIELQKEKNNQANEVVESEGNNEDDANDDKIAPHKNNTVYYTYYEQAASALEDGIETISRHSTLDSNKCYNIHGMVHALVHIYEVLLNDYHRTYELLQRVCKNNDISTTTTRPGSSMLLSSSQYNSDRYGYVIAVASIDDGALCWMEFIELLLRHEKYTEALSLSRQSINTTMKCQKRSKRNNNNNIHLLLPLNKSIQLWDLLFDLEESLGTIQTTKDSYNNAIEIKIVTIQHILNFASFLIDHQYYEEAFTVYERGIELFDIITNIGTKLLWKSYIDTFINRYKGTKMERIRNIFQRCLEQCPKDMCSEFYVLYGEYEEQYGLTKRALSVYHDLCHSVLKEEQYIAHQLFIWKTKKYLGIIATRDIYQDAIEVLSKNHNMKSFCNVCIDFAKMEIILNQIDRARAIYVYGSQRANPNQIPQYWKEWNDFEIIHGHEDTFREMLRIKRYVEAAFSTNVNYNALNMNDSNTNTNNTLSNEDAIKMIAMREGVDMDDIDGHQPSTIAGFVPASTTGGGKRNISTIEDIEERALKIRKATAASSNMTDDVETSTNVETNNDTYDGDDDNEIDIDDIDAEIEEAAAEGEAALLLSSKENDDLKNSNEQEEDDDNNPSHHHGSVVTDIKTKEIPKAVFGGLV